MRLGDPARDRQGGVLQSESCAGMRRVLLPSHPCLQPRPPPAPHKKPSETQEASKRPQRARQVPSRVGGTEGLTLEPLIQSLVGVA